ncbi:hypothetical protein REPUB_Repub13aG0256500 [Reevesia pubescens]
MGKCIRYSFFLPLLLLSYSRFGATLETIKSSESIKDPEYIVSNEGVFRLGFFSPANSTDRYEGIWYNTIPIQIVIWVANRNKPLKDSSGVMNMSEDGNLVVLNGQQEILWSSNVTNPVANSSAQLLDSGNLVLWDNATGTSRWESFQHPTDAFMPTMKIGVDSTLSYFKFDSQGKVTRRTWDYGTGNWFIDFPVPETDCDVYGKCGPFGRCDPQKPSICNCLKGFEPKIKEEWDKKNWTSGCVRSTPLRCEKVNNGSEVGKADGFLKLQMMKIPAFPKRSSAVEDKCRDQCLNNCSCLAYAYDAGIGCMSWSGNLIDIQKFSNGGIDLYIRVPSSELDKAKNISTVFIITVILGIIIISSLHVSIGGEWLNLEPIHGGEAYTTFSSHLEHNFDEVKLQQLPLFNFEELATATNSFHLSKKLGQGGFGPVYRGTLKNGKEIAVKRLSRASGQGLEEFMNEVMVISKLQHRNLVRLLGCCVEGEEKMLVYEYMPNKSLDVFLFDPVKQGILDWRKRFKIIEGISRGLLYLHRDSRLRIIHRDLKASNILLDEELNPKISDFGMARIFGGDKNQAKTTRVVGTYGYMSPEYAMEGRFSEKSDMFSYGVLLLETLSGRKSRGFYVDEHSIGLLGYVWKLWNEDNMLTLIDPVLSDPCYQNEILRCIHVGLLCVQEFAEDRPTVSTVISMLNRDIVDLPTPKQPAFTGRLMELGARSPESKCSINKVTVTIVEGR